MPSDFKGLSLQGHQQLHCSCSILTFSNSEAAASSCTCVLFPLRWTIPTLNLTCLQLDRIIVQERSFSSASGFLHSHTRTCPVAVPGSWGHTGIRGTKLRKTPSRVLLDEISRRKQKLSEIWTDISPAWEHPRNPNRTPASLSITAGRAWCYPPRPGKAERQIRTQTCVNTSLCPQAC